MLVEHHLPELRARLATALVRLNVQNLARRSSLEAGGRGGGGHAGGKRRGGGGT
jgi:hypothetical protein